MLSVNRSGKQNKEAMILKACLTTARGDGQHQQQMGKKATTGEH